jgi:long-subunit acyl-CoA synthetase (AMP-forming)
LFLGLTIQKAFRTAAEEWYPERDFLGLWQMCVNYFCTGQREVIPNSTKRGEYRFLKFKDVSVLVSHVGSGFKDLGLEPGDKIGIMAKNQLEWSLTDCLCIYIF